MFFVKELRYLLETKIVLLFLVAASLLYPTMISLTYMHDQVMSRDISVLDEDHSALSRELFRGFEASPSLNPKYSEDDFTEATRKLKSHRYDALVYIPKGLESKVKRGEQGTIKAYVFAGNILSYATTAGGIFDVTEDYTTHHLESVYRKKGFSPPVAEKLATPVRLQQQNRFMDVRSYASFVVPASFFIIFQQMLWIAMAMSMGYRHRDEKRAGKPRLEMTYFRYFQLFLAHLTILAIGFLFIYLVLSRILNWPTAPMEHLAPLMLVYVCVQFPLGIVWGELAEDELWPIQILLFISIPILMSSGYVWPSSAMPTWVASISKVLAIHPALLAMRKLTFEGATLADLSPEWWSLLRLFVAYSILALLALYLPKIYRKIKGIEKRDEDTEEVSDA